MGFLGLLGRKHTLWAVSPHYGMQLVAPPVTTIYMLLYIVFWGYVSSVYGMSLYLPRLRTIILMLATFRNVLDKGPRIDLLAV